ncbi:MAG: histidinol dehydrogenase [Actinobacteria bacterium]|nr:histidinol dehydrogenase [Actinomycetota bacterium]
MPVYLKEAPARPLGPSAEVVARVGSILRDIEAHGPAAVRRCSKDLDGWDPPSFRLSLAEVAGACSRVPDDLRGHIDWAAGRVRHFAEAQRACLAPLEIEVERGVTLGHRHIPVASVGAYIPGGRYSLVSSALMSVMTAKVAGVRRVVAMSPPRADGVYAPTVYAMQVAGADEIYALGGVQAMGAMAHGALEGLDPVDMVVGAGNDYVAEAKRQLFGRVGIDLLAGPTEILVIADETARPHVVAIDLLSQAEHGPTSPAVLVTTSRRLGAMVLDEIDGLLPTWPTADVTRSAWEAHGTVVVAEDAQEAVALSDAFAPEHLELQVADPGVYETQLTNYGSLFVGEATTVTFGDKGIGTNHTLPTGGAARYTGGLWVGKFLKTVTYQTLSAEASRAAAPHAAAISTAEGMHGHALSAGLRRRMKDSGRTADA